MDAAYDAFLESSERVVATTTGADRAQGVMSAYLTAVDLYHDTSTLSSLSDRDLHFLQLTAEAALFYGAEGQPADDAQRFYDAVSARGNDANAARVYYRSMLFAGEWDKAASVESQLSDSVPVVRVLDQSSKGAARTVLTAQGPNSFIASARAPLENGVYMVGHGSCAWTRRALRDIAQDDGARSFLAEHAMLLSPANTVAQGAPRGDSRFSIVKRAPDWPEISSWALPTFVFVKNGQVVEEFSGWPSAESLVKFRAGMEKVLGSIP